MNRERWSHSDPDLSSSDIFPWLGKTHTSQKAGTEIYAHNVHELHMYWAMPRRICLEIDDKPATCQLTGQPTSLFLVIALKTMATITLALGNTP
ncbi:type I-E CRISPR-associated protein Cse1/CasA [Xenorhabdus hominickii]